MFADIPFLVVVDKFLAYFSVALMLLLSVIWLMRKLVKKSPKISKINRILRKHHKWMGILLLVTSVIHGILSSDALFSLNWGSVLTLFIALMGVNYAVRKKLKKGTWMRIHRILCAVSLVLLGAHLIDVYFLRAPEVMEFEAADYYDGVYEAEAAGYKEGLAVRVTIADGKIEDVEVVSHNEVGRKYYEKAIDAIPKEIVKAQSPVVDSISGATYTSQGIMNACTLALEKAKTGEKEQVQHDYTNPMCVSLQYGADESIGISFFGNAQSGEVYIEKRADYEKSGFKEGVSAELGAKLDGHKRFIAHIDGLEYNTEYAYKVASGGSESEVYYFTLRPYTDGFVYMGDSKEPEGGYGAWGELFSKASEQNPAFVVIGGDIISNEHDYSEWYEFFNACEEIKSVPILTAAGDNAHNGHKYKNIFALPSGYEGLFYSIKFDDIQLVVTDSTYMASSDEAQLKDVKAWLKKELKSSKRKIVVMHHPMYTVTDAPDDEKISAAIRDNFLPVMEEYGVQMILCGHQHVYARSTHDGIIQLMGTSGKREYAEVNGEGFDYVESGRAVYTVIKPKTDMVRCITYSEKGKVIDAFTY